MWKSGAEAITTLVKATILLHCTLKHFELLSAAEHIKWLYCYTSTYIPCEYQSIVHREGINPIKSIEYPKISDFIPIRNSFEGPDRAYSGWGFSKFLPQNEYGEAFFEWSWLVFLDPSPVWEHGKSIHCAVIENVIQPLLDRKCILSRHRY